MKQFTRKQVQARKDKAVRFTRDVLGDPDRAAEIEDESLESYTERKGFEITNPRRNYMAARRKTVAELQAETEDLQEQVEDLEEENEGLQEQLDQIADIAGGEEEEEGEEGEDDLEGNLEGD